MPHIYLQKITVKKMIVRKLYLTRIKPRIKMALMDIPPDTYVFFLYVQLRCERWVKLAICDSYRIYTLRKRKDRR